MKVRIRLRRVVLCLVAAWQWACTAQTTVSVGAHCLSFQLQPFQRADPSLGAITAYFTTYTGADLYPPKHDVVGGNWVFSSEVRPVDGQPGTYATDYLSFSSVSGLFQYGHIFFKIPISDADGNGVPDFLQKGKAVNLQMTGTQVVLSPVKATVNITGTMVRQAGQVVGDLSFNNGSGHQGKWNIPNLSGTASYTRGGGIALSLNLVGTRPDGLTRAWTGAASGTVTPNTLDFASLSLTRDDGVRYVSTSKFTATRSGSRYSGAFAISDGMSETSWVDLDRWVIEVTDSKDSNGNGIPDITDALPDPPRITLQPEGQSVQQGASVKFTCGASGTGPLRFQWQKDGVNLPLANSTSYTLSSAMVSDSGRYRAVVSNAVGSASSLEAVLAVTRPPDPPSIAMAPMSQSVVEGATLELWVSAAGTPPFAFQWRKNGVVLPNATTDRLRIVGAVAADAGSYTVAVFNSAGQVTSAPAVLTVAARPPVLTPPRVTSHPISTNIPSGSCLRLEGSATGSAPLSYQWWKDQMPIPGFTNSVLIISNALSSASGGYMLVVRNASGEARSDVARVQVLAPAPGSRLILGRGPSDLELRVEAPVGTNYAVESSPDLKTWVSLKQFVHAGGGLVLSVRPRADAKEFYRLRETASSSPLQPTILRQPEAVIALLGETVRFVVEASGTSPLSYQWKRNGIAIVGATSPTLTLTNVRLASVGTYTVVVSNAAGSVESLGADLQIEN